jgi:hypothetical protein
MMRFQSTKFAYVCPKCGAEFERNSEWQMSQIDGHDELHTQLEKEGK